MNIYLDYNATTPIDPEVARAMEPFLSHYFGNPSSMHNYGKETKRAVEQARKQVAGLINCNPYEIVFTSGGTESNNYALKGAAYALKNKGNHIITSNIEHPAVSEVCRHLEKNGFEVTYIPVNKEGIVDIDKLHKSVKKSTILISIMHANNEIGTIQPIEKIGEIAKNHNILFHTDAAQSPGKIPVDVKNLNIDLLSIAGHKLYAPKGIGALYIREGIKLEKLIHGADHERNLRAGTENVLEIAGLGKACEVADRDLGENRRNMKESRDKLQTLIQQYFPEVKLNGHPEKRLPNTLSLSFPGIEANLIVNELADKGIAVSAGAACHTDSIDVSAVLKAIKVKEYEAMGTIRFSTGKNTTLHEIEQAAEIIKEVVNKLKPTTEELRSEKKTENVRLTQYTQGMGCACKLRPQELEKILKKIPVSKDKNILIDTRNSDDAAVYKISEDKAIVQTLDFFTPVVDDAYTFGKIAASNALSDIYAMGAKPLFALNIVGFPSSRLPGSILEQILKGANEVAEEAGINIIGGHTIDDPEPKYGMVVTGMVHPKKILSNDKAQKGDALILTKPIGTGILSTAVKRGLADPDTIKILNKTMSQLNKRTAEIMEKYPVNACTDITGFGLLGHLSEMSTASNIEAEIYLSRVPLLDKTIDVASSNIIPGGTYDNLDFLKEKIIWQENISDIHKLILCDAQTSGGLLISIPRQYAEKLTKELKEEVHEKTSIIGFLTNENSNKIKVIQ